MSLSRTWYTDANIAASDTSTASLTAKSILWGLKALLKGEISGTNDANGAPTVGSRWTCESSSDGAGNVNNAGTDLWTSSFDATKINRATAGSNHSWIVLKSPVALGPMYMLIDWSTAADTTVTIRFSYNPFTLAAGTATTAPTSTASWVHTTDAGSTVAVPFNDGSASPHKLHRVTDANGNFWFLTSKNASGIFHTLLGVQTLSETRTGETKPVFSFLHHQSSGRGAGAFAGESVSTNHFNVVNTLSQTGIVAVGGRTYDNSALALGGLITPSVVNYNSSTSGGVGAVEVSATRGWRGQVNAADGTWDFFPVWVYTHNSLAAGIRGRIPDVSCFVHSPTIGAGAPSAAAQERCVVGGVAIPFGVAPSL
jgi:hypothetical protein